VPALGFGVAETTTDIRKAIAIDWHRRPRDGSHPESSSAVTAARCARWICGVCRNSRGGGDFVTERLALENAYSLLLLSIFYSQPRIQFRLCDGACTDR
jgi:hypothetical protein